MSSLPTFDFHTVKPEISRLLGNKLFDKQAYFQLTLSYSFIRYNRTVMSRTRFRVNLHSIVT